MPSRQLCDKDEYRERVRKVYREFGEEFYRERSTCTLTRVYSMDEVEDGEVLYAVMRRDINYWSRSSLDSYDRIVKHLTISLYYSFITHHITHSPTILPIFSTHSPLSHLYSLSILPIF